MKKIQTIMVMALAFALMASVALADTGYTFTKTLKKGSTGAEVSALQTLLVSKGLLVMPAGVPMGTFGNLTVSAVKAYQTLKNISAVGQVGPATRVALNNESAVVGGGTTVPGCPAGALFNTQTAAPCVTTSGNGGTSGATGITTPGVEGILSVTAGPVTTSVVNVGQKMVPILAVRAQAQNSDIAIQRITINLGTDTKVYNKVYSTLYVMNGSAVVATIPLNSSNVVQNGSNYVVNATGFNIIVPKNTYKDITIAADLYSSIESTYRSGIAVTVEANGVRGVDGAGIVQYGPLSGTISQNITINASLVDNAQANLSTDPSSVQNNLVPVTDTTNGQYLQLPVLTFAVNAQNDTLHIRNLKVNFTVATTSATSAVASVAYLYQGSTMVQSAAISAGSATFSNIVNGTAGATIPVNTTVPYTVKVDVSGVTSGTLTVTANVSTVTGTTILNSQDGSVISVNGSANGFPQVVAGSGPAFVLASAPTLTSVTQTPGGATTTVVKYTGHYVINVTAVGTDLTFGLPGTTTPAFGTGTTSITVYKGGVATTTGYTSLSVDYIQPTGTTAVGGNTGFVIARGQTIQVPVTYTFFTDGTNTYSLGMAGINVNGTLQNFMSGLSSWRTNTQ